MPELPEVETMRRGILDVVEQTIESLEFLPCRLKPIATTPSRRRIRQRSEGQSIRSVERVGKRVALKLDSGSALVFEPRMTGLLLVADPPNQTHLRVAIGFEGGPIEKLWYWDRRGLGMVYLLNPSQWEDRFGPQRLGPDALQVDADLLAERLGHSRRAIKIALLDQRAVAGIGNLYAAEILHAAGIDPRKQCCHMTSAMWDRLAIANRNILRAAIVNEGSTLSDRTYRTALNQDGSYQNHHRVYMKEGETCSTCRRGTIQRLVQAQRSTFFCPHCQRKS